MTDSQFAKLMAAQEERNLKMDELFEALMVPSPGQEHSLLDRMAAVTISFESGRVVGRMIVGTAGVAAAAGAMWAALKHGIQIK